MPITTVQQFVAAYQAKTYWWEPLDRPIFWACSQMPDHVAVNEVFAKVALVNRTYRANLHLGTKLAEWKLAQELVQRGFDATLARARGLQGFNSANMGTIMDVHNELVGACKTATTRSAISFAAKYLSFHLPEVFPIFDRKAYVTAWRINRNRVQGSQHNHRVNYDYGWYCECVLLLLADLRAHGVAQPNLKILDNVLYEDG